MRRRRMNNDSNDGYVNNIILGSVNLSFYNLGVNYSLMTL